MKALNDHRSHYKVRKGVGVFSYNTMIKQYLPDNQSIGNITYYSHTTKKHQNRAHVSECDFVLDNVPFGEQNLLSLAQSRKIHIPS